MTMYLAVDIGGANTRWGLYAEVGDALKLVAVEHFPTVEVGSLVTRLEDFRKRAGATLEATAIGIAGPVKEGVASTTNSVLTVRSEEIGEALHCANVFLLNDLEAQAHALPFLRKEELTVLKPGRPEGGRRGLIAVGAGLGESVLVETASGAFVLPSEAGHCDYSPNRAEDDELIRFLRGRYEHVSWERVLSGTFGFRNLLDFILHRESPARPSSFGIALGGESQIGPSIQRAADQGDPIAIQVMRLFVHLYAVEAGNLALRALTQGGVFLAGTIAVSCWPWLSAGDFSRSFSAKGRLSAILQDIPVFVVTEKYLGLRGAAEYARDRRVRGEAKPG